MNRLLSALLVAALPAQAELPGGHLSTTERVPLLLFTTRLFL